jgi:hypothetical protein
MHGMLIERLFAEGWMRMGASRVDAARQVAVLNLEKFAHLAADRARELARFEWVVGDWTYENPVPATPVSPAYCDIGSTTFAMSADGRWVCAQMPDGRMQPLITYDPCSRRWIYLLTHGSFGMLRSAGWSGDRIAFTGLMTMISVECEWRMTWTKRSEDEFGFVNEERLPDGTWSYIDEWKYQRQHGSSAGRA